MYISLSFSLFLLLFHSLSLFVSNRAHVSFASASCRLLFINNSFLFYLIFTYSFLPRFPSLLFVSFSDFSVDLLILAVWIIRNLFFLSLFLSLSPPPSLHYDTITLFFLNFVCFYFFSPCPLSQFSLGGLSLALLDFSVSSFGSSAVCYIDE